MGALVGKLSSRLAVPASETQVGLALALSVAVMSFLLWGLLWQSEIITRQRELIRSLSGLRGH
jgi:hypothetical protein